MGGGIVKNFIIDPIRDFFCSDCCVGFSSESIKSEEHARKVANELAEMKEKAEKSSSEKEKEIMDYISSSMDSFMIEIEKINQQDFYGEKLNINIKAIKEKNEQFINQVVGCISSVLNRRLVQTDKELSTILEEKDKKKRQQNFSTFIERIEQQAINKFKSEIVKTVKAQSEMVSREIETRQKEVGDRLNESIKELTEIIEVKEKSELELNNKQVSYMYQSALCDLLLAEVDR